MSTFEIAVTIGAVVAGTVCTRFISFLLFAGRSEVPTVVRYLGDCLPAAVMGFLVVYSLKDVDIYGATHGWPEGLAMLVTIGIHLYRHNLLLSIAVGTLTYMFLVQFVL